MDKYRTPVIAPLPQAASLEIVPGSQPLTPQEKVRLGQLELTVERNLTGFIAAGRALLSIREEQLWRGQYENFSAYCRERFALARSTCDQLCRSTQVFEALTNSGMQIPENVPELTLRPISQLPSGDLQSQAWRLSSLVAPEGKAPSHSVTSKVSRMIREATEGEDRERALPAREQMFTRPISRLAKIDSFDVNVCLLHVKTPEQAERISHACAIVANRCQQIVDQLNRRFA